MCTNDPSQPLGLWALLAVFVSLAGTHTAVEAQTVREVSERERSCTTRYVRGLAVQLADFQRRCVSPGVFSRIDDHPGVVLNSERVEPYMQASARAAVHAAADMGYTIRISSAFRSLASQYVLYKSLGYGGGCTAAARPGSSQHQSGQAVDVSNWSELRPPFAAVGCEWLGTRVPSDPYHFDCPGEDRRMDTIRSFQQLWNINHPDDAIEEDGLYGPITESRLEMSPADGFPASRCTQCAPRCDMGEVVRDDCSREACSAPSICNEEAGMPSCVDPACVLMGGVVRDRAYCATLEVLVRCDAHGRRVSRTVCEAGCEDGSPNGRCIDGEALPDGGGVDSGASSHATPRPHSDGCSCGVALATSSPGYLLVLLAAFVCRLRK